MAFPSPRDDRNPCITGGSTLTSSPASSEPTPADDGPIAALRGSLDELARTIESLSDDAYAVDPAPGFSSGVGPHVRHCLDHVSALLAAADADAEIDYDGRKRGTPEETSRSAGLARIARMREGLPVLEAVLDRDCAIRVVVTPDAPARRIESTWTRETLYVFQHTVHHLALLSAIVRSLGVDLDSEIGRAPSTRADDRHRECAR